MSINETKAQALFNNLRTNLLAVEQTIAEIVETKAWEPLGYNSFVDAWKSQLSDVKLAGAMEAAVVLAMFDDGASDTDVAMSVAGVGPKRVKAYRQAASAGMGAASAKLHADKVTHVRPHNRKLPTKRNAISLDGFTDEEITTWNNLAAALGVNRNEMLMEALRDGMTTWSKNNAAA